MVLRDTTRSADPRKIVMAASDQPLKKKQRIDAPDIDDQSDNSNGLIDIFSSDAIESEIQSNAIPAEYVNRVGESPDSGTVSEDAVDCTSEVNKIRCLGTSFSDDNACASGSKTLQDYCDSDWVNEFSELQSALVKHCLCGVEEVALRRPFCGHFKLNGWPVNRTLKFLSNLQLLFDVYLRQNHKGEICSRVKEACDALVRNEYDWLTEVMELSDHKSKFVNFVAGRVVSSFIIVAKDNIVQSWLQRIVDNVFIFETFNRITVQKINFSLDVIKRVVEWKDVEQHPLEESAVVSTGPGGAANQPSSPRSPNASTSSDATSSNARAGDNLQNAFSNLNTFNSETPSATNEANTRHSTFRLQEPVLKFPISEQIHGNSSHSHPDEEIADNPDARVERINENGCLTITLTDSESFDTSYIKCLMIKTLEHRWPILVRNIKLLLTRYLNLANAENCILTFLSLWENIISVKANLSVMDTKPFYADLQSFVDLLRCTTLSGLIYTQLLSLLNEVLCYGSTLALQDILPDEICTLAHSIVRFVKDFRLLSEIQVRNSRTGFNFISLNSAVLVNYGLNLQRPMNNARYDMNPDLSAVESSDSALHNRGSGSEVDRTMLQKITLLVLKSVAVTVKEMRCDSSDSSIDSSDYNAIQDMQIVERSIRDVLKKLDSFIKTALDFHPETPFTKILVQLFSEQDDYLIESMVCTLDITVGIVYRNSVYPDLIPMLNPNLTFIEFLKVVSHDSDVLLDYLVSYETCFLLYLLRFLKYVRRNWSGFIETCQGSEGGNSSRGLDDTMTILIRLRLQISRLVSKSLFPYNISPVLRLLEVCESLYEGNEFS